MRIQTLLLSAAALSATFFANPALAARDQISVVGSSTVYPFTTVVAERFGRMTDYPTPKIESTGTGGGMKQFCGGVGTEYPDMTNASRAIKASELADCAENGVTQVVELKVGYDGVVIASSYAHEVMELTLDQLFLSLAAYVPNEDGTALIENPYQTWSDVDPSLPDREIEVLGPPPTSGTRDAFLELVMQVGAERLPLLASMEEMSGQELASLLAGVGLDDYADAAASGALAGDDAFEVIAHTIREDGAYVEAGENDNLIVQKLEANGEAVGIFGFSFLDQNSDFVQGHIVEGADPTFDNIADGTYVVSRPLYLYVKAQHVPVIPGMREFLDEYTSDRAWGETGYLTDRGLIPMPREERQKYGEAAANLTAMQM